MRREAVRNVALWVAVLTIFAFTGKSLGEKYEPGNIIPPRSLAYTQAAYLEMEREATHWKARWKDADAVLMDIARAGR